MKNLTFTLALILAGTTANAGSAVYTAPTPVTIEPTTMNNGSGAWLIPLAIIAILALTLTGEQSIPASDIRLKTDIAPAGTAANGLPLYTFRYIGGNRTYLGVMAQDVLMHTPDAVVSGPMGFMAVNYEMLGMEMQVVD